ncbi:MAG: 3'(2'),5'-bisphosphate nucleotidase CysQ [Parvularculaceae bacterium]
MMYSKYLPTLINIALAAGAKISEIYATDFDCETKEDGSSVTQADKLGEEIILRGLKELAPDIPVLAEEAACAGNIPDLGETFFLVDPLDGTREFVNRTGEFTVNIALIHQTKPVLGVVYAPGCCKLYYGAVGEGAWLRMVSPGTNLHDATPGKTIEVRKRPYKGLIAVASRSHCSPETTSYLTKIGAAKYTPAGSSLKFCLIAEGLADVYPRLGRTMEWDTGAGQAILEAAGGRVLVLADGKETGHLCYCKQDRDYDNPHFVAWGGPA